MCLFSGQEIVLQRTSIAIFQDMASQSECTDNKLSQKCYSTLHNRKMFGVTAVLTLNTSWLENTPEVYSEVDQSRGPNA